MIRQLFLIFMLFFTLEQFSNAEAVRTVGSGDGKIHIIPALSAPSVKNGGTLTIQAVVKAPAGVAKVEAEIEGVETIQLAPAALTTAGVDPGTRIGVYKAEWKARGLQEKIYPVTLHVTDLDGHTYIDRTLKFSDPAAGSSVPGTTSYPETLMQRTGRIDGRVSDCHPQVALIDPAGGYLYFGTNTHPARVIKVRISDFSWVASIDASDNAIKCGVIDPAGGYAYFGTYSVPGTIVRIRLSDFTVAGSVTLNSGEEEAESAVIDTAAGYAYFGLETYPAGKVVKIRLSDFTQVNTLTFNSGEWYANTAAIDTAAGFAYFGVKTSPGKIVKVNLSDFTRVGAITLNSGENDPCMATIDPAGGYVYFGMYTSPTILVKIRLTDFSRVGALTLASGESYGDLAIDPSGGYMYGFSSNGPKCIKVRLSDFSRTGSLTFSSGSGWFSSITIDPTGGYVYFGTDGTPTRAARVRLSDFTEAGEAAFDSGDEAFAAAAVDPSGGYAYFAARSDPAAHITKVRLSDFTRVATLHLSAGEEYPYSAIMDPSGASIYFGVNDKLVKVRTSDLTRVDALTINSFGVTCPVVDPVGGYLYAGVGCPPGRVYKIRLSDFTSQGSISFSSGEDYPRCAAIDTAGGYAYFGTDNFGINTNPGKIVKVSLSSFQRVGVLTLESGENRLRSAVIDAANGYAYFGTITSPGRIIKVRLSDFTRVGAITCETGEDYLLTALNDSARGYAYFSTGTQPSIIVKVRLSDFSRVGAMTLTGNDNYITCSAFDQAAGNGYFATESWPVGMIKVSVTPKGAIHASQIQLPEGSIVHDVRFYSHAAQGNLRLGIYNNASPKTLLWESGSISNTTAGGWITAPVSAGTPGTLVLPAGTYWLAWQSDSTAGVAGYTAGASGCGFSSIQPYGNFPATISSSTPTAEQWSQYVTYDAPPAVPGSPGAGSITPSQINWTWTDLSNDETGFKVYADPGSGPPTTLQTTTAPDATHWLQSPLSANAPYSFQVSATNVTGDSAKTSNLSVYTLIEPIGSLVFSSVDADSISVAGSNTFSNLTAGSSGLYFGNTTVGTSSGWVKSNSPWVSGGLSPNTPYTFNGNSRNGMAVENTAVNTVKYTSAAMPFAPVLSDPQLNSLKLALAAGDGNPSSTPYAINCESTGFWVQEDGSLGSSAPALTAAQWGTKTVTGLSSATNYVFRVRAVNAEGYSTNFSASSSMYTRFVVTYVAGEHGSITGTSPQAVPYGGSGSTVTAVAAPGYHFVQWSDGVMTASRTDTNITANKTVTAAFSDRYTLTYTAGANGSIVGITPQSVVVGTSGTAVTAVGNTGYHFQQWSDLRTDNPRIDTNVTNNLNVTAQFAINQYTLNYTAGAHGSISGTTPQTVTHGGNGTAVTAVPAGGYYFIHWTDGNVNATRTDTNVVANKNVTAVFNDHMQYTLYYTCTSGGRLVGQTLQAVDPGGTGTRVDAIADPGYMFIHWSDDLTGQYRTDWSVNQNRFPVAVFWPDLYQKWVRFDYVGTENGMPDTPYNTLAEGIDAVNASGRVWIYSGSTPLGIRITKTVRLEATGGAVTIGRAPTPGAPPLNQAGSTTGR